MNYNHSSFCPINGDCTDSTQDSEARSPFHFDPRMEMSSWQKYKHIRIAYNIIHIIWLRGHILLFLGGYYGLRPVASAVGDSATTAAAVADGAVVDAVWSGRSFHLPLLATDAVNAFASKLRFLWQQPTKKIMPTESACPPHVMLFFFIIIVFIHRHYAQTTILPTIYTIKI